MSISCSLDRLLKSLGRGTRACTNPGLGALSVGAQASRRIRSNDDMNRPGSLEGDRTRFLSTFDGLVVDRTPTKQVGMKAERQKGVFTGSESTPTTES